MAAHPLPRYHSLDALRAAMMLLGLVLHAAASCRPGPGAAGRAVAGGLAPAHGRRSRQDGDEPVRRARARRCDVPDAVAHARTEARDVGRLLPPIRILVAHGVFFAFGWLVYRRRDVLDVVAARWKTSLAAGAPASVAYLVVLATRPFAEPGMAHVAAVALASLSIWTLIAGLVGLFVRHLDEHRPVVRYFSDAAYWMYLIHLPLVIWATGLLVRSSAPALLTFAIVLGLTFILATGSYHDFVRSTRIGALLNGRRFSRSLPAPAPEPERATVS